MKFYGINNFLKKQNWDLEINSKKSNDKRKRIREYKYKIKSKIITNKNGLLEKINKMFKI